MHSGLRDVTVGIMTSYFVVVDAQFPAVLIPFGRSERTRRDVTSGKSFAREVLFAVSDE